MKDCDHREAVVVRRFVTTAPNRMEKRPHHLWCPTCGAALPLTSVKELAS